MQPVHLIGNAHLDPVWLWRFQEGYAEIKATFRSALDRIKENDEFIFTTACAAYYEWVEQNCPEMFEEIREAVKAGKWSVVGGMWIQPDCNMPSAESFARHFLYSQRYFMEKFGFRVRTGYNVDSFGHTASMPKLLRAAGIENYVYMRPGNGDEMQYPFPDDVFRWKCGDAEVDAFRIPDAYCMDTAREGLFDRYEKHTEETGMPMMLFYGVGNHGGGPTVRQLRAISDYMEKPESTLTFSSVDRYFSVIRASYADRLPVWEGELQNHASGCYSANAGMKQINRRAENRLQEAERMEVLASHVCGSKTDAAKNAEEWKKVLFNQFHDIMCGCALKSAYDDAFASDYAAIAHGLRLTNEAVQRMSWAVDTAKNIKGLSKENRCVRNNGEAGIPVVVFNPLPHAVKVPVSLHRNTATMLTDDAGNAIPFQRLRAEYTNGGGDKYSISFLAELPPYGWRTFWTYDAPDKTAVIENPAMQVSENMLSNGLVTVCFDRENGWISSVTDADGKQLAGAFLAKTVVIDDTPNDTWAHAHFVFDNVIGQFGDPVFAVRECGPCVVSLSVTQTYKNSTLTQTYKLYAGDPEIHVSVRMILNEVGVMVKTAFDTGIQDGEFVREAPAGYAVSDRIGREEPMQRYMLTRKNGEGLAVVNDAKYSASERDGVMAFVAARSCYYTDHFGVRDDTMIPEDIGVHEYNYGILPYKDDLSAVVSAAEVCNAAFPIIPETYHEGPLAQAGSFLTGLPENITVIGIKPAEDGNGVIVRFNETAGKAVSADVSVLGTLCAVSLKPYEIRSYRLFSGTVTEVDFTELPL